MAFENFPSGLDSPASALAAVTPADGADLLTPCRALWVGGGGNIAVQGAAGGSVVLQGVISGTLLPIRAQRVLATGTTATNIVALW